MQAKPVNQRAAVRRLNRLLNPVGMTLRKTRPQSRWASSLGEFYILNLNHNSVDRTHVSIKSLADEFGILKAGECLALERGAL